MSPATRARVEDWWHQHSLVVWLLIAFVVVCVVGVAIGEHNHHELILDRARRAHPPHVRRRKPTVLPRAS